MKKRCYSDMTYTIYSMSMVYTLCSTVVHHFEFLLSWNVAPRGLFKRTKKNSVNVSLT